MKSLDIVDSIVSFLGSSDKLSLYCTSRPEALISEARIRLREIKKVLNTIEHDTLKPRAGYLRRCVKVARKGLGNDRLSKLHMVVLTCNPFALERLSLDERSQLHVLCPGPLPWTYFKANAINGWLNLNPAFSLGYESNAAVTEKLDTQDIRSMVNYMRSGHITGQLENISIAIIPGEKDTIQSVLGSLFIDSMNAGERRSLLVNCMLTSKHRKPSVLERFPRGLRTSSGQLDVERELNFMLDDRPVPAFTIKIKYEHSALPADTTCEYSKEIFKRPDERSSLETNSEHHTVQQRLAYHLASVQKNRYRGLEVLYSQFPGGGSGNVPDYAEILTTELKYQARIQERYELSKSQILPVLQKYSLFPAITNSNNSSAATLSTVRVSPKNNLPQAPSPIKVKKRRIRTNQGDGLANGTIAERKQEGLSLRPQNEQFREGTLAEDLQLAKVNGLRRSRVISHDIKSPHAWKGGENVLPWLQG